MNKQDLLAELLRLDACTPARHWVARHPSDDAAEIWRSCDRIDWMIWFAGRRSPRAIAAFALRCAERSAAHAAHAPAHYAERAAEYAATYYAASADRDASARAERAAHAAAYAAEYAVHAAHAVSPPVAACGSPDAFAAERKAQLADLRSMWEEIA